MKTKFKSILVVALCAVGLSVFAEVPKPLLVPDYNRDGKIDNVDRERLAAGEAFTVWLNDDDDAEGTDDGAEAGDTNNDLHDVPGGDGNDQDCEDDKVNGRCDLLDFFPVLVDVSLIDGWDGMTWKLSSKSVNVVFTQLKADTAGDFHTKEATDFVEEKSLYEAEVKKLVGEDGEEKAVELPDGFLKNGRGVIIVEGAAIGEGLTLRGEKDGSDPVEVTLKLSVKNVEDMYGWLNLRPEEKEVKDEGAIERSEIAEGLREQWKVENSTVHLNSSPSPDNRHFILVHGYNTNHEEARGNAAEFYKKLWQSGSDAMFTAVEWRGDQSQIKFGLLGVNFSPNYHVNVENAFAAARPFADACRKLPGEKILVGHSLGNMLIASAIRDYGLDYTKYVMLNAAVPREAYDAGAYDEDMVDDDWLEDEVKVKGEGEGGKSLTNHLDRASRWYRNFAGKEYDPYEYRRKLAWRGRFANLPRTVNYYSPTDNILLNPDPNEPDPDEILDRNDPEIYRKVNELLLLKLVNGRSIGSGGKKKTGFGFWSFSEKMKGTWLLDVVNDVLTNMLAVAQADAYKREAGWGENDDYEEKDVFDPANTRFTPFLDERMKVRGMLDILPAETERVRAQHLADAIPAESFAAGANEVATLENVNEESFIGANPEWPLYEGEEEHTNLWNHSAFREVAFYHTSKFYATLAETGKPRVIVDTDLGGSKDDLFARDLAARMHREGKLDVLAVMTNGTDDVTHYTNLFEAASEKSVVICVLGTGNNLTNLLEEAPELVAAKVKELRVVDEAIVPQGWPTKIVVTGARPAFYESKDILSDFPAGTLSPAIREAEQKDPTGAQLAGPMAILPLTEGETITNQTAAAILDRLRAIYRTGNPSVSVIPISLAEAGVDYNGSVLSVKIDGFNPGAYAKEDLFATLTVAGETYDDPVWTGYDELSGIGTLEFTVPADKVTAGNAYEGEVKVGFKNETLGENVVYTRKREFFVQGRQEKAGPKTGWFHETDLEMPTNYVPATAMPERCLATVETTVFFTGQTFTVEYQTATNAVQGAVRIVKDGADGWKFQYYACVGKTNEDSFVRGWWDFNFSGEGAEEIKPERGKSYTVYMQADYFDDNRGGENTLVISALETGDNRPPRTQFIGNLVNARGGKGNTPRLNSVGLAGEGTASLVGNYYTNSVNANLARINGTEYATVAAAVAAVSEGQAIRLLHAASWKPTEADLDKSVKFLNRSCLVLDLSGLPANAMPVWTDVDGNDGTLTVKLVYADTVVYGTIRTAEAADYVEGALAVADGKYVYVGDEAGVVPFIKDGVTEIVDHRGKGMVMPGCTDGHSHYAMKFGLANMKGGVMFASGDDKAAVLEKLKTAAEAAKAAGKKSLFGFGWNFVTLVAGEDDPPTLAELDDATNGEGEGEKISMVILDSGGHHAFCNSECLLRCGIIDGKGGVLVKKIPGGYLELDENDYPTGYAEERAMGYLMRMGGIDYDELMDDEVAEISIRKTRDLLLSTGYTAALEGWSNILHSNKLYAAAKRLDENDELNLVFPMTYEVEPWMSDAEMSNQIDYLDALNETYATGHVQPKYLKIFMDGVVETKTGAMLMPYKDDHEYYRSFWSTNRLADITRACNAKDLTVHVHTMGDAAIRDTVTAYIMGGDGTHRNCLVHLRNVSTNDVNDFERMAANNIACSAGFTWHVAGKEAELMEIFLEKDYIEHAYPIKSFFDAGVKVSSHSDYPANEPCPQDPFGLMEVALTGQRPDLPEDEKLAPYDTNELVTVEQVFEALTINGAWQLGLEKERGSIAVGKWADFVLADQDVFECATTDIHKTKVVSTWFEGEMVYPLQGSKENPWVVGNDGETPSPHYVEAWTNGMELVIQGAGTITDLSKIPAVVKGGIAAIEINAGVTGAVPGAFAGFVGVALSLPDGWQGELPKDGVWYGATGVTMAKWPLTVKNVTFLQRYPWNGLVDIACDLSGAGTVSLKVTTLTNDVTFVANPTLTGETVIDLGETGCATNGVKFIWNAAEDLPAGFKAKDVKVKVTAEK